MDNYCSGGSVPSSHIVSPTNMKYTISLTSQIKMALHATKYGYSTPIHGIVLGNKTDDNVLEIVDVVPVCHEVPTKPIVDMSLRLTDAYLQQLNPGLGGGIGDFGSCKSANIIGWYTANAQTSNDEDAEEVPNAPACRIVSSLADSASENNDEGSSNDFVLLLVSTPKLVMAMKNRAEGGADDRSLPICKVYEKSSHRTYTQQVDESNIDINGKSDNLISMAMDSCLSKSPVDEVGGGQVMTVYDYVDHLEDGGRGDWLENRMVKRLIEGR